MGQCVRCGRFAHPNDVYTHGCVYCFGKTDSEAVPTPDPRDATIAELRAEVDNFKALASRETNRKLAAEADRDALRARCEELITESLDLILQIANHQCPSPVPPGHVRDEKGVDGLELRPSVAEFARRMETVLRRHDAKKGGQANWRKDEAADLFVSLEREVAELKDEVFTQGRDAHAAKEAIDVANFAMMIADVCDPLPDDREAAEGAKEPT